MGSNTNINIPQYGKKGKGKSCCHLGIKSKTYSLAAKCYEEQIPQGFPDCLERIRKTDKTDLQVLAIIHDRDTVADGIWKESAVKPHLHIIIRCTDRKKRVTVGKVLRDLGIVFRPGVDDELWENHGIETVGNFAGYATYLTHDTEEAVKNAKEHYDTSEIISNLSEEEIIAVRNGYTRVSAGTGRVSHEQLEALDREAFDLGHGLGDYDGFLNSLSFDIRSHAKFKTIEQSYGRGVKERIKENKEIIRLCIYIQGEHNCGKSYSAQKALRNMGMNYLSVNGGGTGKFDKLLPNHDAIVMDDYACENILNMSDNYMCETYRRNSNNPVWAGKILIVTSNIPFIAWAEECGITVHDSHFKKISEHYEALKSRFFLCRMVCEDGFSQLKIDSPSTRGTEAEQLERNTMFAEFFRNFNAVARDYHPKAAAGGKAAEILRMAVLEQEAELNFISISLCLDMPSDMVKEWANMPVPDDEGDTPPDMATLLEMCAEQAEQSDTYISLFPLW